MSAFGDLLKLGISSDGKNIDVYDGRISARNLMSFFRNVYYVDAANGADTNDGKTPTHAFATLSAGYAALTENQHDALVILGGASSLSLSAQFTWAKDNTHLIGVASPAPNSRARIGSSGVGANAAFLITSVGSIFANLRLFENTDNASAGAFEVQGNRNYFLNVDMQGQAHATAAGGSGAFSLKLNGGEENRFDRCLFGLDTVTKTDGKVITLDGGSARNEFVNCRLKSACETAGIAQVGFVDTAGMDRFTLFKNTLFYNFWTNHGGKLDEAFTIPAAASTHDIILEDCAAVGITEWSQNDRGSIWTIGGTPAAGAAGVGTTGIAVEPS